MPCPQNPSPEPVACHEVPRDVPPESPPDLEPCEEVETTCPSKVKAPRLAPYQDEPVGVGRELGLLGARGAHARDPSGETQGHRGVAVAKYQPGRRYGDLGIRFRSRFFWRCGLTATTA